MVLFQYAITEDNLLAFIRGLAYLVENADHDSAFQIAFTCPETTSGASMQDVTII